MARPKTRRSWDNPVWVDLRFKDGKTEKAEVNEYRVTDTHVVLTVLGSARRTRYVAVSELSDFEFNEPKDRVAPVVYGDPPPAYATFGGSTAPPQFSPGPFPTAPANLYGGPVSMSPGRDALVAQIKAENEKAAKIRKANPDEKSVVEANAAGIPAAGMM